MSKYPLGTTAVYSDNGREPSQYRKLTVQDGDRVWVDKHDDLCSYDLSTGDVESLYDDFVLPDISDTAIELGDVLEDSRGYTVVCVGFYDNDPANPIFVFRLNSFYPYQEIEVHNLDWFKKHDIILSKNGVEITTNPSFYTPEPDKFGTIAEDQFGVRYVRLGRTWADEDGVIYSWKTLTENGPMEVVDA
jgi:hypothetical protein